MNTNFSVWLLTFAIWAGALPIIAQERDSTKSAPPDPQDSRHTY
jgi:hypothetical protein